MNGIATAASASRRATLVWVKAAGFSRISAVPSSRARCTRSISTCSALDCRHSSAWPAACARAARRASMLASVARP
jgi:hypothetical protein